MSDLQRLRRVATEGAPGLGSATVRRVAANDRRHCGGIIP